MFLYVLMILCIAQTIYISYLQIISKRRDGKFIVRKHVDGTESYKQEFNFALESLAKQKTIVLQVVHKIDVSNDQSRE